MQRIIMKRTMAVMAGLIFFVASFQALGGEDGDKPRIPAHTKEWTDYNESDPGITQGQGVAPQLQAVPGPAPRDSVADDLQKIVVLCATMPQSAEFDRAWASYLEEHYRPGMNVERLINEILVRAEAHVGFGDGRRGARLSTGAGKKKTRSRMRSIATKVIGDLR